MSSEMGLPFGQTDADANNLKSNIDVSKSVSLLQKQTSGADGKIHNFINNIPRMLEWLDLNGRIYPWRETTNPWSVYVAEVLLQKTSAEKVKPVYGYFIEKYPNPYSLSGASEEEIKSMISGLGFGNQRTRTFQEISKLFCAQNDGDVPNSIDKLKEPWGVGDYSARATQIFARGEIYGLIDVNIARIFERVFEYKMPENPHREEEIYALADALVPRKSGLCRSYNLSLLDLGALLCVPENPRCSHCPLKEGCSYFKRNRQ
jgi:A/G-specific adenine glycosylase